MSRYTRHTEDFEIFSKPALSKIVLLVDVGFFINSGLIFEIVRVQLNGFQLAFITAVIGLSYISLDIVR